MSNDIELLLEEYGFLDEEGFLLPPDDPVIIDSMERFAELRSIGDVDESQLDTEERLELQELHDLHSYYLDQLKEYEKNEYTREHITRKTLRDFLLTGKLEDTDEDDEDYEEDDEEEDDDYDEEEDDDYDEEEDDEEEE